MTIAIGVKVGDGIVLGADSAATLSGVGGGVANVYFNAEKLTNLVKGLPLGMAVYGLGGLDGRSVTSLAKDLRARFTGSDPKWRLDRSSYTMEWVATQVRAFFYEEFYCKEYPRQLEDGNGQRANRWDQMGFFIAGFSANADHSEVWSVEIDGDGACPAPVRVYDTSHSGVAVWAGAPEALNRLFRGIASQVYIGLVDSGISSAELDEFLASVPLEPLIHPAMPLQDAIDLVKYMVDVTVGFVRFSPGAPTVAEPTDIAAITKHEGFRWVRRKHYFAESLNPQLPDRAGDASVP
jgi:hypothetical protein